jgi:hypothetical protein
LPQRRRASRHAGQRLALDKISGMKRLLEGRRRHDGSRRAGYVLTPAVRPGLRQSSADPAEATAAPRWHRAKAAACAGQAFIEAVEAQAVLRCWTAFERPENLPTIAEIREPATWLARMASPVVA